MTAAHPDLEDNPASTVDHTFEHLLLDIVGGTYPGGSRLPSERDLAAALECSRSTLREALGRLAEWSLIETRRGSGMVVRHRREWSMYVLPAYLRASAGASTPATLGRLVLDLLHVRRTIFVDIVGAMSDRLARAPLARARQTVQAAWDARADHGQFVRHDFDVLRALAEAADFLPGLWILNSFAPVYFEIADLVSAAGAIPANYLQSWDGFFAALAEGDGVLATERLDAYLRAHDTALLDTLGIQP